MAISQTEHEQFLQMLRDKYKRAAEKYGNRYFDLNELETRIKHHKQTQSPVETFLKNEKEFYETLKDKAQEKMQRQQNRDEINKRFDEMIEKNEALVKKYPEVFFHPGAPVEVRHFVGAITNWYDTFVPLLSAVFKGTPDWMTMREKIADLERFYARENSGASLFLKNYAESYIATGSNAKESATRQLLQTGGSLLYQIARLMLESTNDLSSSTLRSRVSENIIGFISSDIRTIADDNTSEALKKAEKQAEAILKDFRIQDLVQYAEKNNR